MNEDFEKVSEELFYQMFVNGGCGFVDSPDGIRIATPEELDELFMNENEKITGNVNF